MADETRAEALGKIVSELRAGGLTFLDLLRGMESCLVTTEDSRRARGVLLLAEAIAGYTAPDGGAEPPAARALPTTAAALLTQYFTSKLDDFAVIRAALMGCTALLRATADVNEGGKAPAVSYDAATEMADRFFEAVHVPSLVQADRQRSYGLIAALLTYQDTAAAAAAGDSTNEDGPSRGAGPPLGSCSPEEQLETIVAACDGEKDPRNVLLVCELWAMLPGAFCGPGSPPGHRTSFNAAAEELYDVVAAYFPVSFRPPPGDTVRITHEQLAATLRGAMSASPSYAPWAIPHVLESLAPDKPPRAQEDALAALAACGGSFGRAVMAPYLPAVWSALRGLLLHPPAGPELTPEGVARWATRLFAAEWAGGGAPGSGPGALVTLALGDQCLKDAAAALSPGSAASGGGGGEATAVERSARVGAAAAVKNRRATGAAAAPGLGGKTREGGGRRVTLRFPPRA